MRPFPDVQYVVVWKLTWLKSKTVKLVNQTLNNIRMKYSEEASSPFFRCDLINLYIYILALLLLVQFNPLLHKQHCN